MKKCPIKRVMLVYPNQRWLKSDMTTTWDLPPYTICLLATMLQDAYEVCVVDAQFHGLSQTAFRDKVATFKPDCVGISLLTSEYAPILDITAQIVRDVDAEIVTIAGGVHVTTQYDCVIKNHDLDYCIRGEGEYVLRQLLDSMNDLAPFPEKGVVYRNEDGTIIALPPDLIEDLDSLPFPDFSYVDYPAYINTRPRYGVDSPLVFPNARIITSRGCPIGCSFCQVEHISGKAWRRRSAEKVVDELFFLKERYGIKGFYIEDDNAFVSRSRTKKMLSLMIERKLNLKWKAAGVPIFSMNDEIFALMGESGCQMIGMAVESGVPRILKEIINKPVNLDLVPQRIESARKLGIFVVVNFIIGFPGESWDEIRQTLRFAETCGADYCKIYAAQPLRSTKLFDMAKNAGFLVGDEDTVEWRYGRIETDQFTSQDISILRAYEWERINFNSPEKIQRTADIMGIAVAELNTIRKKTREGLRL